MRRTLEERKEARRAKCDKDAPSLGIETGLQDKNSEMLIVRWLKRRESMAKRMEALDAKITAFRKQCKHVYAHGETKLCRKCAQRAPDWVDTAGDALAQ